MQTETSLGQHIPSNGGTNTRPNIVIIMADDMGYGDLGCYNDQSKIPTPHMNQLASEGMRFTDAYSPSSVCTPTRYGLLTGRYCWRTPLQRSSLWAWDPSLIEPNRLTLAQMLKEQGYSTAAIGKWHLGWDWPLQEGGYISDEFDSHTIPENRSQQYGRQIDFQRPILSGPTARGFEYFFGVDTSNCPPYCFIENDRTVGVPSVWEAKGMFGVLTTAHSSTAAQFERAHPGPALPAWDVTTIMPTVVQRTVQYIERQTGTQPFFLYVPLTAPHTPIAPSAQFIGKSKAGRYGDFVHQLDWSVGQIRAALARAGMTDNSLIIVTSDHGPPHRDGTDMAGAVGSLKKYGHNPSRPWRGIKSDIWEGGSRIPFIAHWPGQIPSPSTCHEPILLVDLMRTIAGITGYQLPNDAGEDSFDISPTLFGQETSPIREHLVFHSGDGMFAIRQGPWKLIQGQGSGGMLQASSKEEPTGQLYNLQDDPKEQHNLYSDNPEKVEYFSELLETIKQQGVPHIG